ncbi:MAG: hypothetical protein E7478_08885 [Ruminococcaceae bacterium]|nr:hypothetical protein [Oscillospiraceae bacterium]
MAKLVKMNTISLKNCNEINEDAIQQFIFEDPSVLGLGELTSIKREKIQPLGGRLDLLLTDDDGTRYEVEVQLGATDPSHIIRTIEYWDTEKKRYPQYDHCAVIVAEEITGRFMNVISLFNGSIPLIALQMSAYRQGDDILLSFTKVLDRVSVATDSDDQYEITDRKYWESRSTSKTLKNVDSIFNSVKEYASGYELKYNKFYIGMSKDGISKNFLMFRPRKNYLYLLFKGNEDIDIMQKCENVGLEITYKSRWKEYHLRLDDYDEYLKHKELIDSLVKGSMEFFNISE